MLHSLYGLSAQFSWGDCWNFILWALPTIFMGFVPIMIAYLVTRLNGEDFLMNDFYIDGGLLFLGPALLGALCGELRNKKVLFQNDLLSGFTMLVLIFVLLISSVVYTNIRTRNKRKNLQDDPYFVNFVGELSWGVTGASAVYVMSIVAIHMFGSPQGVGAH